MPWAQILYKLWTCVEDAGADRISRDRQGSWDPVPSIKMGNCHGISKIYSFLGIIPPLPLLGDSLCETEWARVWKQCWFLIAKTAEAVRHPSSITTGFSRQAKSSCSPYMLMTTFGGILESAPSQFNSGHSFKINSVQLLIGKIDFQTNPTACRKNNICPPKPQKFEVWRSKECRQAVVPCQGAHSVCWVSQVWLPQPPATELKGRSAPCTTTLPCQRILLFPGSTFLLCLSRKSHAVSTVFLTF